MYLWSFSLFLKKICCFLLNCIWTNLFSTSDFDTLYATSSSNRPEIFLTSAFGWYIRYIAKSLRVLGFIFWISFLSPSMNYSFLLDEPKCILLCCLFGLKLNLRSEIYMELPSVNLKLSFFNLRKCITVDTFSNVFL